MGLTNDEATREMIHGLARVVNNLTNFGYNKEVSIEDFKDFINKYEEIRERCRQIINIKPYDDEINARLESFPDLNGIRV